jgi:hypothetical protein
MESLKTLSEQKTYWLTRLQKGIISQSHYDKLLDQIEAQEREIEREKVTVTFFTDEGYTEKTYTGECKAIGASLDMESHIQLGGYCMAEYKNKAVLVTNINQLYGFKVS